MENCEELTQIPVVKKAIEDLKAIEDQRAIESQKPIEDQRPIDHTKEKFLLEKIFQCVYECFCEDFINWIVATYSGRGVSHSETGEMAKDAFQEGLYKFCEKTKKNGLQQGRAKLRTIIFSFAFQCFRGIYRRRGRELSRIVSFDAITEVAGEENYMQGTTELSDDANVYCEETLQILLSESEYKLYQAIQLLSNDRWKKIIVWNYFDKIKPMEIAEKLNVTRGSVDNILSDARKELKEILITKFNFLN